MSLFILDTDMLTLFQHGHPLVQQRAAQVVPGYLAVSVITVEEQLTGWQTKLRRATTPAALERAYDRMTKTVQEMARLRIFSFSQAAIQKYEDLLLLKLNVGKMDLRIAATALEQGATVVTRNARDFGRVPGLTIEDWSV